MNARDFYDELENGLLLAYLDAAVDDETKRRIDALLASDPALRAEAQALAHLQETLTVQLAPDRRPSAQELGEFVLGLLPRSHAQVVERLLATAPALRRQTDELQRNLTHLDLPRSPACKPGIIERMVSQVDLIVAQLASGWSGPGVPALVPVGVRGDEGGLRTYRFGDAQLIVEVQPDADAPGLRSILGLLLNVDQPESFTAELYQVDRLVTAVRCDSLGNFVISGLGPAMYELVLAGPAVEVLVPDLFVT